MFLVTFLSWRREPDEQKGQEDGIYIAISTFLDGGNSSSWDREKPCKESLELLWISAGSVIVNQQLH